MSVHILHPSLRIHGSLTARDREYLSAAQAVDIHTYMLSYVEQDSDIEEVFRLDPQARILAKIESVRGLAWVEHGYPRWRDTVHLMAARGDLHLELGVSGAPGAMLQALKQVRAADAEAVAASRILSSLAQQAQPECAEVTDLGYLHLLGYRRLLLGDELGWQEDTTLRALETLAGLLPYLNGAEE